MDTDSFSALIEAVEALSFRSILRRLPKAFRGSVRMPIKTVYSLHAVPELQIFEGDSRDDRFAKQFLALLLEAAATNTDPVVVVRSFLADNERAHRTHSARR